MALTRRQQIVKLLSESPDTVRGLAAMLGVRIRQIVDDLEHVRLSTGHRLTVVQPAECLRCGTVLGDRKRLTAPSRCPRCKSERTTEPLIRIETAGE